MKNTFKTKSGDFRYSGKLQSGIAFCGKFYGVECIVVCKTPQELSVVFDKMTRMEDALLDESKCKEVSIGLTEKFKRPTLAGLPSN